MNSLKDFDYLKFEYQKEDLSPVFGTILDTYSNHKNPKVSGQIFLWELLQTIKYGFLTRIDLETYFTPKYFNGEINPKYEKVKKSLASVCFNARFDKYKELSNLKSITNLMFLDIDNFDSESDAIAFQSQIIDKYDWIIACYLSLSKIGLHIIINVDYIHNNDDFNLKYDYISNYYFQSKLDKASKSLVRFTIVPCDYNIYINENPNILRIEHILQEKKKSICSEYTSKKEEIICTAYTFCNGLSDNEFMNNVAPNDRLRFKCDINDSEFDDPNVPIYIREGIKVIEINLFPYINNKVFAGHRTSFIGALSAQLIFLNARSGDVNSHNVRDSIIKYLMSKNNTLCSPPLPVNEVIKSFNANWRKFKSGKLNVNRYMKKKRAFWSTQSTLNGNEKRSVTCRIKNKPIVDESKRKIAEAIQSIIKSGGKLTQVNVSINSGLVLSTVKKYRDFYYEQLKIHGCTKARKQKKESSNLIQSCEMEIFNTNDNNIEMLSQCQKIVP